MADTFVLSGDSVRQLREIARRVIREEVGHLNRRGRATHETGLRVFTVKASTGGLSALSTDAPGSGTGTIHYNSTSGVLTELSTDTVTVYNSGKNTVLGNEYMQVVQDLTGTLWALGSGTSTAVIGKLTGNTTTTDVGTLTVYDQSGTSMPAATTSTISVLNITGETLKTGVFLQAHQPQFFDKYVCFPWELQPCSTST